MSTGKHHLSLDMYLFIAHQQKINLYETIYGSKIIKKVKIFLLTYGNLKVI